MPDGPFLKMFVALIVILIGCFIFIAMDDVRLMEQCTADGHPEYVCRSYVYRGNR